jgi:hypothetical protein
MWFIRKAHAKLHIKPIGGLACNNAAGPKIKQDSAIIFYRGPKIVADGRS